MAVTDSISVFERNLTMLVGFTSCVHSTGVFSCCGQTLPVASSVGRELLLSRCRAHCTMQRMPRRMCRPGDAPHHARWQLHGRRCHGANEDVANEDVGRGCGCPLRGSAHGFRFLLGMSTLPLRLRQRLCHLLTIEMRWRQQYVV